MGGPGARSRPSGVRRRVPDAGRGRGARVVAEVARRPAERARTAGWTVHRADHLRQRHPGDGDRPRGGVRPGGGAAQVRLGRRGGPAGQRDAVRVGGRCLDAGREAGAPARPPPRAPAGPLPQPPRSASRGPNPEPLGPGRIRPSGAGQRRIRPPVAPARLGSSWTPRTCVAPSRASSSNAGTSTCPLRRSSPTTRRCCSRWPAATRRRCAGCSRSGASTPRPGTSTPSSAPGTSASATAAACASGWRRTPRRSAR